MDSKQVTKEINSIIRPVLKENGFKKFSGRTYWRHNSDRIDILNFQSFNSYNADVMGCTTFSFAVNLATFIKYIPSDTEIKEKDGLEKPAEYQGHFRGGIKKGIDQKEFPRDDIWFIRNDGGNLSSVVSDCNSQIQKTAFDWYKQFESKENVLRVLLEDQIDMKTTWGFGNMDSPNRNKCIAYTAIELGKTELAVEKLQKLLISLQEQYEQTKYDYYLGRIKELKKEIKRIKNYPQHRV
jgi:hypothetical protein